MESAILFLLKDFFRFSLSGDLPVNPSSFN